MNMLRRWGTLAIPGAQDLERTACALVSENQSNQTNSTRLCAPSKSVARVPGESLGRVSSSVSYSKLAKVIMHS
jgi:hypothetical protein